MAKLTLQEYVDMQVKPEYRQKLKTVREAVLEVGWVWEEYPSCCGKKVEIENWLGVTDKAWCEVCGRTVASVLGPCWSAKGNCVKILDSEKVDVVEGVTEHWLAIVPSVGEWKEVKGG